MTVWLALLILLGAVSVLLLVCRMCVNYKAKPQNEGYDERQKLYQGKACGFGLAVGSIYYLILSFVLLIPGKRELNAEFLSMIVLAGTMLAYTAVNCYCLMTGALLPLNNAVIPVFDLSCIFAALKLFVLGVHIIFHGMSMGDDPVDTWEDLLELVFWTLHAAMYLIAKRREKE